MRSLTQRILKVIGAGVVALFFPLLAGGIWAGLFTLNLRSTPGIPWSVAAMGALLWWAWRTATARKLPIRAVPVSRAVFGWSMVAGVLAIVALAGFWIVMFGLVRMPGNVLPDSSGIPWLTMALLAVMGSLVSPLSEEAGFRGYYQSMLERDFRGPIAIAISSAFFALGHLNHGVLLPKQLAYFLGGVMLGTIAYLTKSIVPGIAVHIVADLTFFAFVWPNDAARQTIWQTGADTWFWIHVAQAVGFAALAVCAYRKLARAAKVAKSDQLVILPVVDRHVEDDRRTFDQRPFHTIA
jgi:membrane protease YdiL (CAAX protease family)